MPENQFEEYDSSLLFQEERALREERRRSDDGDRENARIDRRLNEIKKEWERRSH